MKQSGFRFIHAEMLKYYQEMVKEYGKNKLPKYLSYMEMQYLYLIAVGNIAVPRENKEAYDYFLSLVDTNLEDGDVIIKAQSAIVQKKAGKIKSSNDFIKSLEEHLVDEDEMGAHFAFLDKPYTWAMIPVPQHVATMEALQYVGGHDELIEEMTAMSVTYSPNNHTYKEMKSIVGERIRLMEEGSVSYVDGDDGFTMIRERYGL